MTAKKKPPEPERNWSRRALEHPRITLGTIATVVAILGVLVPWAIAWEDQYQRKIAAREAEAAIRADMKAAAQRAERALAWQRYGQIRTETIVLRNRMNDCAVNVADGRKQSPLEATVCRQYEDEYREAAQRAEEARKAAQESTKGAP